MHCNLKTVRYLILEGLGIVTLSLVLGLKSLLTINITAAGVFEGHCRPTLYNHMYKGNLRVLSSRQSDRRELYT